MNDISITLEVIEAVVYGGLLVTVFALYTIVMATVMNDLN